MKKSWNCSICWPFAVNKNCGEQPVANGVEAIGVRKEVFLCETGNPGKTIAYLCFLLIVDPNLGAYTPKV